MDGYMKQQGFTLIEILVVSAIIMAIGQVSINRISNAKYWIEPKKLFSVIQEIRTIAIINNQHTVLCPSHDSFQCIKNWQLPLIVFIDVNNNKKRDVNENIIQTITPSTGIERTIEYPRSQIRFNGQGQINGYTGTLKYCSKYNTKGIVLSRVGRIRYILSLDTDKLDSKSAKNNAIICSDDNF
jgi:type IV fimbrial biogenesis protein FimT